MKAVLIFAFCIFSLIGCATVEDGARGILGVSTNAVEQNRKEAIKKAFNYDYNTCYTETLKALKGMGAYIYAKNTKKQMVAIYVSETDTTEVGIFFKKIGPANTEVEVSSRSTYAKEFISEKIFSFLEKKVTLQELEAKTRAKEEKDLGD